MTIFSQEFLLKLRNLLGVLCVSALVIFIGLKFFHQQVFKEWVVLLFLLFITSGFLIIVINFYLNYKKGYVQPLLADHFHAFFMPDLTRKIWKKDDPKEYKFLFEGNLVIMFLIFILLVLGWSVLF